MTLSPQITTRMIEVLDAILADVDQSPGMAPDDLSSLKQLLLLRMADLEAQPEDGFVVSADTAPRRRGTISGVDLTDR